MFVPTKIVAIVEGHGEKAAAPALIRRILHERINRYDVIVSRTMPTKSKGRLISRLENFIRKAKIEDESAAILILLDADDDCPVELAVELSERARDTYVKVPIAVVCANRKYENWFLASDKEFNGDAEEYSGAKRWLRRRVKPGVSYKETTHQVQFTAKMDINAAFERSRSFQRLCHAVEQLVEFTAAGRDEVTPRMDSESV